MIILPITKELIDYMNAVYFVTGNIRKGKERMNALPKFSEVNFLAILDTLTFGGMVGCTTIAQMAASETALASIVINIKTNSKETFLRAINKNNTITRKAAKTIVNSNKFSFVDGYNADAVSNLN